MTDPSLKILYLSAEVVPFAKTGGLADVAGALPKAIRGLGHDIRVAMPRYGRVEIEQVRPERGCSEAVNVPMDERTEQATIYDGRIGAGRGQTPSISWTTPAISTVRASTCTPMTPSGSSSSPARRWRCAARWIGSPT